MDDYVERLSLDELRRYYDAVDKASDTLAGTANQLIANASLILGLMTVLQLSLIDVDKQLPWYWIGFVVAIALYVAFVFLANGARVPQTYKTPLKADWEQVSESLLRWDSVNAIKNILSTYIEAINYNYKLNSRRARLIMWATRLFVVEVILLIALSIFSSR